MNRNKTKKIRVWFPANLWQQCLKEITDEVEKFPMPQDINARIMSAILTEPTVSAGHHKAPRIECNITWTKDPRFQGCTIPQIVYASADETRLFRIIEKYGGKIVPVRSELNQYQQEETDNTSRAKVTQFENANEVIE